MARNPLHELVSSLKIDPTGLSEAELEYEVEAELRRRPSFARYVALRDQLKSLGVQAPFGKEAELRKLLIDTLTAKLKERGIVANAFITIPAGAPLGRHGQARVSTGQLKVTSGVPTIRLRFSGDSKPRAFNALVVLQHAEVSR